MADVRLIASEFEFPEGPAFDGTGRLYLVNLNGGFISRVDYARGESEAFARTGGKPNGSTFHRDGSLWVADAGLRAILRITGDARVETVAEGFRGPNDLCFDPHGRLYFTDPAGTNEHNPVGEVLRIGVDGGVERVLADLAYPNGLAFDASGAYLYVAHMRAGRIDRWRLGADGLPSGPLEPFATVSDPSLPGGPDGMAFDVEGRLYVALFRYGVVRVVGSSGTVERDISVPGDRPTNVAFGAARRRTLFITEVATNAVYAVETPAPGLPLWADDP